MATCRAVRVRRGDPPIARRAFVQRLMAALAAAPWAASAQTAARPARVAFLATGDPNPGALRDIVEPIRLGLRELGYVEGQNLLIDLRWADGRVERLPALLAELMQLRPDVLVAVGFQPAQLAMKTSSALPIVAAAVDDPVQQGLADTYARPGRNVTGVSGAFQGILAKRLQLLKDIVPSARTLAVLHNPESFKAAILAESISRNEQALGVRIARLEARDPATIEAAFATIAKERVDALCVLFDPVFWTHRARLTELCRVQRLPAVWPNRGYLEEAEGLLSYQGDFPAMFRRSGELAGKILKGEKPGEIPFEQVSKLDLAVNLKAAKAIGLTIPRSVLLSADTVIE
jgi:putative ABC transport system substrate-binding protein